MSETITIDREQLEQLVAKNEELKADIVAMRGGIISIMDFMGLIDPKTRNLKEEIEKGEESFIPSMLKGLGNVVTLLTNAGRPHWLGGAKYKEQLAKKFQFIQDLIPVVKKYQDHE